MKELRPEMVATHGGAVGVHEGHAFCVEAAVSVGGRNIKPGLNIHRFANRIPLLFEVGVGCVRLWDGSDGRSQPPLSAPRPPHPVRRRTPPATALPCLLCSQGGSDVVTRTAIKRVAWSSYKINQNSDKAGVGAGAGGVG